MHEPTVETIHVRGLRLAGPDRGPGPGADPGPVAHTRARALEDRRDGLRGRVLRIQLQRGRSDRRAHLRRAAQHVLSEPGRDRVRQGRHPGEPGRVPGRSRLRQDRRPRGGVRAGGRRHRDLQEHPAGLRQPAHGEGDSGTSGSSSPPSGPRSSSRGDNWNYSRSILFGYAIPFYHVGVRGTIAATDKVTLGRLPRQRLEQRQRDQRGQDVRGLRHHQAEPEVHLGDQRHGGQGDAGLRRHSQRLRHHAHPRAHGEAQPDGATSTTGRRGTRAGGASPATPSCRPGRSGRSSAATSTPTTRTAAS